MSLPSLVALPTSLQPLVTRAEETFLDALRDTSEQAEQLFSAWPASRREAFGRVCAASDFVCEQVSRDPQMLLQLAELGWLDRSLEAGELRDALSELIAACDNEDTLALTLRRFRSRQQVRIIWRDLTRQAALAIVPKIKSNGWFVDTELLLIAAKRGYKIKSVPVKWDDDPTTTVNIARTAAEDIKGLLRLRFGGIPRVDPPVDFSSGAGSPIDNNRRQ